MNRTVKYQRAFCRIVGFAGKRFLFSPPPPPSTFFCSRSNFCAITRYDWKRLLRRLCMTPCEFYKNRYIQRYWPATNWFCVYVSMVVRRFVTARASDISRGRGPAKFRYFREIPRNSPKKREIPRTPPDIFPNTCRQNIFNTYLGY